MKYTLTLFVFFIFSAGAYAQLKSGSPAPDFSLANVDGSIVSLADYKDQKAIILVFTSNSCPFSLAYESRLLLIHKRYANQGFQIIAVNSNDEGISPDDTAEKMAEKNFPFPYLKDRSHTVCKAYEASRNPQIFLLENRNGEFYVAYSGSIDDNVLDPKDVGQRYLELALMNVYTGRKAEPDLTRPVGCKIKLSE